MLLSDTGEQIGRGSGLIRGTIIGAATTLGGLFHALPFLIGNVNCALIVAGIVVASELSPLPGCAIGSCTSAGAPRSSS
jgi:hypothetical protein